MFMELPIVSKFNDSVIFRICDVKQVVRLADPDVPDVDCLIVFDNGDSVTPRWSYAVVHGAFKNAGLLL